MQNEQPKNLIKILADILERCSTMYSSNMRNRLLAANYPEEQANHTAEIAKRNYRNGFVAAIKQTRKCIGYRINEVANQNDFTPSQIKQLQWATKVNVDVPMPDSSPCNKVILSASHAMSLYKILAKALDVVGPEDDRYDEFLRAINALKYHECNSQD